MPTTLNLRETTGVGIDLGPVQETMLITLWARAVEARRRDALIRDPHALSIFNAIDYDFQRFSRGWKSQIGVAVRDRVIDRLAGAFMDRHPEGRIVNLGAGLDTRCFRLDNGHLRWIDIDLPDAIALRRQFIEENERLTFIEGSALDFRWLSALADEADRPTLLIAEGVLMFFRKRDVRRLLERFALEVPHGEAVFDLIGELMVRLPRLHDTLPRTRATFQWGAYSMREVGDWSEHYAIDSVRSMLEECPERWGWMRWCRHVPFLRRQFFVTHVRARDQYLTSSTRSSFSKASAARS